MEAIFPRGVKSTKFFCLVKLDKSHPNSAAPKISLVEEEEKSKQSNKDRKIAHQRNDYLFHPSSTCLGSTFSMLPIIRCNYRGFTLSLLMNDILKWKGLIGMKMGETAICNMES